MVALEPRIVAVFALRGIGAATEVLLMRRTAPPVGTWAQVAGKIEPGETAWQAALRELREETGLAARSLWTVDAYEMFYEPDRDAFTLAPCFVAKVDTTAAPTLNAEHDQFRWMRFAEAQAMVSFGGQRRVLRAIEEDFLRFAPHPDQQVAF